MNKKCGIEGCKEEVKDAWIDIIDDSNKEHCCGRIAFCDKHFDKIFPYIQKKEKEMQDKEGKNHFWCFAPLSLVKEALNK